VRNLLKRLGEKAKITKPLNSHGFRHSRITEMVRKGYGESIVKKIAWGHQNSKMMGVYAHLMDDNVDEVIAEKYGIKSATSRERDTSWIRCSIQGVSASISRGPGSVISVETGLD
jgi:integrase/recombinase XerD